MRPSLALSAPFLLAALAASAAAAPVCHLRGRPFLEARVRGAAGEGARAVDARLGEELEVGLMAPGTLDGRPVVFGEWGRGRVSFAGAGCGALHVSWRRVEPRMQHLRTPAPNRDIAVYANAVVFGPQHGRWLGYDRIEYVESPLPGDGPVLLVRDARPGPEAGVPPREPRHGALGTMRLAATVVSDGERLSTPDASDAPGGLVSDRVLRYSFRQGDDLVGWLTSYFNVPYLFGSAGAGARNQAERYLGADCADVLVAALRRGGARLEYSSVAGLVSALRPVAGPVLIRPCEGAAGCAAPQASPGTSPDPAAPRLRFGVDVRPGDFLALDYVDAAVLPRAWDHIGAVVEDRGPGGAPDGVLGPEDLLADTGSAAGLKFAPLGDQGEVRVVVLRPRR